MRALAGDRATGRGTERSDSTPTVGKSASAETEAPRQGAGPYRGHTFQVVGEEKQDARSIQHWRATGVGGEYEVYDTNDEPQAATVAAPGVAQADLSRVAVDPRRSWQGENGIYKESVFGSYLAESPQIAPNMVATDGKLTSLSVGQRMAQAGTRVRMGRRQSAESSGELGTAKASTDAYMTYEAGVSGNAAMHGKGVETGGAVSAKAVTGVTADADLKTPGVELDGVDKPLDAGVGVHADAVVGARVGVGGRIGVTRDFIGAEVSAGGFVGAEASANVHGNIGPLTVRAGVSGIAGAGVGIDGGIVFENGKIKLRGKALAAFGFGGSGKLEIELDLDQAIQLGIITAQKARELADANHDGEITIVDGATLASNAMVGTARGIDSAVDGALARADANDDGKLRPNDIALHLRNAGRRLLQVGQRGRELASDAAANLPGTVDGAGRAVGEQLRDAAGNVAERMDLDGNGRIGLGDGRIVLDRVEDSVQEVATQVREQTQLVVDRARVAMDINHDGRHDAADVRLAAREVARQANELHARAVEAGVRTRKSIERGVTTAVRRLRMAADRDGDGAVGVRDLGAAARQANHHITTAFETTRAKAEQARQSVARAADRNNDGRVNGADLATGAAELRDNVRAGVDSAVQAGKQAVNTAAREIAEAGDVLRDGLAQAGETVRGTFNKIKRFFG